MAVQQSPVCEKKNATMRLSLEHGTKRHKKSGNKGTKSVLNSEKSFHKNRLSDWLCADLARCSLCFLAIDLLPVILIVVFS